MSNTYQAYRRPITPTLPPPPPPLSSPSSQDRPVSIISTVSEISDTSAGQHRYNESVQSSPESHRTPAPVAKSGPLSDYSEYANDEDAYRDDARHRHTDSFSDVAEAMRNTSLISGDRTYPHPSANAERPNTGHTTPTQSRDEDMVTLLLEEVHILRGIVESECLKRSDMKTEFQKWKEIMTHNSKALIQNAKVDVHKPYMRIYPLLSDNGLFPDMSLFPTTVGSLMKLNEASLTSLVVFYDIQEHAPMEYYAKYTALRDHLGIEP